ncbi:hypothetical protein SNE40_006818 [Patella caerulea]|uniref:Chitin-binding type-2 domain-containing protein n=1 Tax=Patella caerulea TaxID=87958 RepID=A0AAN8K4M1_PATCE
MNFVFVLMVIIPAVVSQSVPSTFCVDKDDGVYYPACRRFIKCVNGTVYDTECFNGQVLNLKTGNCDDAENVDPPCGRIENCTGVPDGRYPNLDLGCTSFHTCKNGTFLGHNFCPDNLVFNTFNDYCDWSWNTAKPCGICDETTIPCL